MGDFFQGLFLLTFIGFLIMWGVKFVTKKAAGELYTENEKYQKVSKIKRYVGVACVIFLVLAALTKENNTEDKKSTTKIEQQAHIYDKAKIVDLKNGPGTKTLGKVSVLEINSSDLTQEALEDWYFNYASPNVGDKGEKWNFAVIVYKDKANMGTFYNGIVTKDVPIEKNKKDDAYSMTGNGVIYVDDGNGHLKKFEPKEETNQPAVSVSTLHITPAIFQQRYNEYLQSQGGEIGASGALIIGEPNIQSGSVNDTVAYANNDINIALNQTIDKNTGEIKEVIITSVIAGKDGKTVQASLMFAIVAYNALIYAVDPNSDRNAIQGALGLQNNVGEWANNTNTTYNNVKYFKGAIKGIGLVFGASAQ